MISVVVPDTVKANIAEAGFNTTSRLFKEAYRYIVEGDILLSEEELKRLVSAKSDVVTRSAGDELYTTLVSGLPRELKIYVNAKINKEYTKATEAALWRYNALDLALRFTVVANSSLADIQIEPSPDYYADWEIYGTAGLPSNGGDPYPKIQLNTANYDTVGLNVLTTAIAHKIGHCIGLRHAISYYSQHGCHPVSTTYKSLAILGTAADSTAQSWMLPCPENTNRPFTEDDKVILKNIY